MICPLKEKLSGMGVHTFNPNAGEAGQADLYETEASLVYIK